MESVWAENIVLPSYPRLSGDLKVDVLIVGGGLAGILCAYELKRAGINYALIEADRVCRGVTRNTTAKVTSQHGLVYHKLLRRFGEEKARLYWEVNQRALERYRRLSKDIPCDFEERDSFVYSIDREDKLEQELAALGKLGVPADYTDKLPLPIRTAGAVRFSNQGQFHPLKFVAGILPGLNIYEQTAAKAFDGCDVVTDRGKIRAEKIIVATHFPIFNKHGGYFLKMYQHRSYVMALEGATDVDGMYLDESGDGLSFRNYNGMLLLGGGAHRTGKQGGNWAELSAFAHIHYPGSTEVCRWATQDCMSLDGAPYIGGYGRGTPNLYVATGFNKWGMTSAMAAAMILLDLVQGRENPYAPLFYPARTVLRPQLAINALEATANLLTLSKPRCPHMGCALKWNSQEHSWDCPCHGSRFTEKGKLLDNPSTGDLN